MSLRQREDGYQEFEIESGEVKLRELQFITIEQNAYRAEKFKFRYLKKYENK